MEDLEVFVAFSSGMVDVLHPRFASLALRGMIMRGSDISGNAVELLGRNFLLIWVIGTIASCLLSAAMIGGVGYAIYWGLSLAERAVEVNEHGSEVESEPSTVTNSD